MYPQNIDIKEITGFAPPEEVNAIQGNVNVPAIIKNNVEVQSIEDTIKEVEDIIKSNPKLPRLTRGEILDILENLTKQDNNIVTSVSKESYRDPKSLMVVKAYTPAGSGQVNLEELYTKEPITSIIDDENEQSHAEYLAGSTTTTTTTTTAHPDISTTPPKIYFHRKSPTILENKQRKGIEKKKPFRGNIQFKESFLNDASTTTEKMSTTIPSRSTPKNEIKRRRRPQTTTEKSTATTYHPRKRVSATQEIQYPNHQYHDKYPTKSPVYIPENIKVVTPPQIAPTDINSELEDLIPQEGEQQETFVPMRSASIEEKTKFSSLSEPSIEIEVPDHLKKVVANLNLAAIRDPESITSTSHLKERNETEKIKNVLASIGIYSLGPTTTEIPNAQIVADSLSEDMQNLLKNFGLLPDPKQNKFKGETISFNPERAEIRPEAYVGFKPLPEDTESRKEMETLLAQFGLLNKKSNKDNPPRKGRQFLIENSKKELQLHDINLDVIPDDLKPLLGEMGFNLGSRAGRKIREKPHSDNKSENLKQKIEITDPLTKKHVFNPSETVSEEEIQKLGKLLDIVKSLADKNDTITEEDMKRINQKELGELIASLNVPDKDIVTLNSQNAPNPIDFDFGLNKNEVKRQEVSTDKVETTTVTTTTEESKTPSIKDLEDSFGGQSETVTESSEPPPTTPQNGFYYLLDWNSFFEIDDQKGKRVNLRFQPHVGEPKRFLSVSVP